ncbi:MAG: hypothetical protein KJZ55_10625, partial [Flavobacteriales bacterium]|nr:hypothetical protein [Flavobacteriales bacterium]
MCQNTTIGNGTAGYIKVCLTTNNIPSGGGTSCSPGASCGTTGGGWSPRINIQTSGGTTSTTWIGSTAEGTCFYVPVQDGYAIIQGFCLTAGTVITYETVDACDNNLCSGATPCVPVNCNNCSTSCGTASGFSSNPTVAQVVSACETNPFIPALQPSTTNTSCYDFRATNTTVNFNVIITSNCSGGNVSAFSWSLYNATCGGTIQTGTLASLTFSGLTVGNDYVFCYTFTVPATCTHSQHCPYFVGATVLPVTLSKFDAKYDAGKVNLDWTTETEINNDYFTIERSSDMENFEVLGIVKGNGNSNTKINY